MKIFQKYIHIFPPTFAKTDYLFWPEFLNFFGGKFKFGKTSRLFFTSLLVFTVAVQEIFEGTLKKKIKVWKTFFRIWFTFYWSFYSWIVFNNNKKELPRLKVSSKVATCLNGRLAIYLSSKNTFYRMNWWGGDHSYRKLWKNLEIFHLHINLINSSHNSQFYLPVLECDF